jgi:predicted amidohydrolase
MDEPVKDKKRTLRIGLVQMRCEKAAIQENLEIISNCLAEAVDRNVDILAFPEMSITGYTDTIRYPQAILRLDGPEVGQFLERTKGTPLSVLAGIIEENPAEKPFITQIVGRSGELLGFYRKINIKGDEEPWFSPGKETPIFKHHRLRFGMAICADIGNEAVFAACARQRARIVFECAAPGLYGEQARRDWQSGFNWWKGECQKYLGYYAAKYKYWIAVATQAGRTIDEDFPGGGYVFAPDGRCLYATPDGSPGAVYLELDLDNYSLSEIR